MPDLGYFVARPLHKYEEPLTRGARTNQVLDNDLVYEWDLTTVEGVLDFFWFHEGLKEDTPFFNRIRAHRMQYIRSETIKPMSWKITADLLAKWPPFERMPTELKRKLMYFFTPRMHPAAG
ncbi:hypothetical protein [Actinomadura rubrisoli]|uniref:Uncharacterized protein n=1 Tax=Actinomadura rubrisoli TaxID=2530368 RepID=A0A4R5CIH9_9ACTN|nr:hypothetical protein [Actinomadura rubrisoli]TDD97162.1 hypothetical protein E1298_01630 [Actinomadura rubrisoli]